MIYDRNIIGAHCTGYACILVLLEQPFIQGPVSVGFTFEDVVLNFLVSRVQNTLFYLVHLVFYNTSCCNAASYRAFSECLMTSTALYFFVDLVNLCLKPQCRDMLA